MKDIPLGALNSKIYEKSGETFYKISPILGMQTNVFCDWAISTLKIIENSDKILYFKNGITKIKMTFKPAYSGAEKVRVTKYIFGVVPLGSNFCEISVSNKEYLREQFGSS
jgi:hypothetical protein